MPLIAILTSLPIRTVSPSLGKPTKKVGFERQTLRTLRNEIQCYYFEGFGHISRDFPHPYPS
jgi:hypothetical protein